ncbi:metal dependent phosphohydrolase [Geothermobacter ehrlichii]|uniref:Metal dependent phosphohydrolase n=1 Tax=Geothermobacter ehrlichii TaxID=213224 RepID=A0A5D3WN81_9BACT|nr:HDIG domain-containing metalloprotein [Geothermobacter ehrlichii]TYP00028.1 metal dependent phosphohydrolase [Geothermobacter ehrlichii]
MSRPEKKTDAVPRKLARGAADNGRFWGIDKKYQPYLLLCLLAFVLTLIIVPKGGFTPAHYAPGDVAAIDIKAPRDLLIPDEKLTAKKRQEAQQAVLPLYDFDPAVGSDLTDRLRQVFGILAPERLEEGDLHRVESEVEGVLGLDVDEGQFAILRQLAAKSELHQPLLDEVTRALSVKAVANLQLFKQDREKGVVVRDLVAGTEAELADLTEVVGVGEIRDRLLAGLKRAGLDRRQRKVLHGLLVRMVRPNLTFNKNETEERKRRAAEAVQPILIQVKKGEMIVREGARVTEEQVRKLKALRDLKKDRRNLSAAAGMLLVLLLVLLVSFQFAGKNISKFRLQPRDMLFLVLTFSGLFVLIKLAIFLAAAVETAFPYIDSASFYYLIPFAAGAVLVRIVLNSEVALVFSALVALAVGLLFSNSLFLALYVLIGSLTGAHFVRHCGTRSALYRAGWQVSLVNMAMVFGLHLMAGHSLSIQLLYKLGFAMAGGFFCAIVATAAVPLIEAVFKYTTDIKLLELANLNTPVLRQLMVQAPGTYHHSIVVGNLAEAGAEAIGANPLLARVAAYYHDIGKIKKPLYFVENQSGTENKHDKLSPSMSALILMAHIKDGVELARENRLGRELIDILRQHHGTALMKYFYDKAKNQQDPEVQQVDERDYRYPGPKPQTREAALIMLADAVEAAGRTLTDPTPARIQGMVQKIINNIFIDGQLDECELTLKDLHKIARSFNRILAGIFHYRIDYPEPVHKEKEPTRKKNGDHTDRESAGEAADRPGRTGKGGAEDLKRLGMS